MTSTEKSKPPNLDGLNNLPWPREAVDDLDHWQQGDVIRVDGIIKWLGLGGYDALTGKTSKQPEGEMTLEGKVGHATDLAVITSQTCDVIGFGAGAKQPWVQVSPICEVTDANQLRNIRLGWLVNHALVTAKDLDLPDGSYAVDLRHSFPVSKSVLLQQARQPAFADEQDVLAMAERLAVKFGRASHHDLISGSLAGALRDYVKNEKANGKWRSPIEQFRVVILNGTRLHPRRIVLLVITKAPAAKTLTSGITKCVKAWQKRTGKELADARIDVESTEFRSIDELSVRDYRESVHLPIEEVTRTYWF